MKQIIKTLIISLINICLISAGYALPEDNNTSIDNETEDCYLEADNCQYHIKKRRS